MEHISLGKLRGLQQCSTPRNVLAVLAMDHRNNLRHALNPQAPDRVPDADMVAFKHEVTSALASQASAVLLDPEFGAGQCLISGALPGQTGLVVALDATGYTGEPTARQSEVLTGWSVTKSRRMGANAVKLLVYYHPDSPTAAEVEQLVYEVAQACRQEDMAFFLEPLSYSLDPSVKKLPSAERRRVVIETARRLTISGVDILKAEFPVDIKAEPDEQQWASACAELTEVSQAPWILLSASVDYDTYLRQVVVACQQGATGVAVGRAVWQEALALQGHDRRDFLEQVARPRLARLAALCNALARPWSEICSAPPLQSGWYVDYGASKVARE